MRPNLPSTTTVAAIAAFGAAWAALPAAAQDAGAPAVELVTDPGADAGAGAGPMDETEPARPEDEQQQRDEDAIDEKVGERSGPRDDRERARLRTTGKRRKLGTRTLRKGMSGSDVRHLQKILTAMNFETRVDGRYGPKTRRSVRRYDRWKEPRVNGVVHKPQARRMKQRYRDGARYRKHVFPVRGWHSFGGPGSLFGAPRGGRLHQGQDIAAAEGTKLVAVHEGRVATRAYQAGGAGNYVVIHGKDRTDSVYMHLMRPASVRPGERVMAGQKIGRVGTTGSSTGPHLHFELWTRHWFDGGDPFDPLRKLKRWDRRT